VLHVRRFGAGPRLVALHGFTLTGAQFTQAAIALGRTIHAPDLPGHGFSEAEPTDFSDTGAAVGSVVDGAGSGTPLLGYSLGARIALSVALAQPELLPALVIVSGTPGIDDAGRRTQRAISDAELARSIRDRTLDEFLDDWTSSGITDTTHLDESVREPDRLVRRQNTPAGLANALEGLGQGVQPPLWNQLGRLTMQVLLICGEHDPTYIDIAHRMRESIPQSEVAQIPASGHNPLLDAPEATYAIISAFLERLS